MPSRKEFRKINHSHQPTEILIYNISQDIIGISEYILVIMEMYISVFICVGVNAQLKLSNKRYKCNLHIQDN